MKMPTKLYVVDGAEETKLLLMPCVTHGSHVVLGGGLPGTTTGALHMQVEEAQQLVDVLRAGSSWAGLRPSDAPGISEHGSMVTRSGLYGVTISNGRYWLSWASNGFAPGLVCLDDAGRERAVDALLELLHGKAAAA